MPLKLIAPKSSTPDGENSHWAMDAINATYSKYSGAGIVVAVLDTGIKKDSPAFDGIEIIEKDFTGEGNGDNDGHGTHCAGTIVGRDIDGIRIGVARGVNKLLIGKVLGKNAGSTKMLSDALMWAIENGANVISMSLGIDYTGYVKKLIEDDYPTELAVSMALEAYTNTLKIFDSLMEFINSSCKGKSIQPIIICAAAGNESQREINEAFRILVSPPAISEGVISVAALGIENDLFYVAPFSNYGATLIAPGVDIFSASKNDDIIPLSGTSMATPHVAGVACLWGEKLIKENRFDFENWVTRIKGSTIVEGFKENYSNADIGIGIIQCP
jgi:subtilisin family serine protease